MISSEAQLRIVSDHRKKQAERNKGKSEQDIKSEKSAMLAGLMKRTSLEIEAERIAGLPEEERSKLIQEFVRGGSAKNSNTDLKERSRCRSMHALIQSYLP
jgi:hypothetical protein